ncbi:PAS domain-containing protein [bacterium]|nr:PAS domain-containing protein [candidate division CSSED10-310 bacterium]
MLRYRSFFVLIGMWILPVCLVTVIVAAWSMGIFVQNTARDTIQKALRTQIRFVEMNIPEGRLEDQIDGLQDLCFKMRDFSDCHVTITRLNGDVLADSHTQPWKLMNQAHQPEMINAKNDSSGMGLAIRSDPDTGIKHYYLASQIARDGKVLGFIRVSVPRTGSMSSPIKTIVSLLFLLAVSVISVRYMIRKHLVEPVHSMTLAADEMTANLQQKFLTADYKSKELSDLAGALERVTEKFRDRLRMEIRQKRQLETMFRSMVDAVFVVDNQECILRYNQAATSLFQAGETDISGRTILEVIRNTQLHQFIRKTLSRNDPQEDEIVFHGYEDLYFKATGVAIDDGEGTIIGAMVVLNNVTRIRKLERIRKDFVANVSHELKTPITAIQGFVETLLDSDLVEADSALRFLRIILKQTRQLHAVIEDLLSLSRLEQTSMNGDIKMDVLSLESVLSAAVASCETSATEQSVILRVESDSGEIPGNRTLLRQAVVNLVDNAIKYGPEHSEVIIEGRISPQKVTIRVIDNGPGIPIEYRERIFERFYRIEKSRSRDLGGSGLGLAIVKHIVQAHHGHVTVQSEPGRGSIFTIEVPLKSIETPDAE